MAKRLTDVFSELRERSVFRALVAEVGVQHVHDLPSQGTLRMQGPGTNTSGNPYHAQDLSGQGKIAGHSGKAAESSDHFADSTSWGYRLAGRLDFNNVLGAVLGLVSLARHDREGCDGILRDAEAAIDQGVSLWRFSMKSKLNWN